MDITLRGPVARIAIAVIAVLGFLLALGEVLDAYDAWWKFTVPATVVYAAVIWFFVLKTGPGETRGVVPFLVKLFTTIAFLMITLGVVGLCYDLYGLVLANWHYIVVALGIVVVICLFALIPQRKSKQAEAGKPDDPVS